MGYTPTEWHTGDIITEEKLNNMEAGIADGGLPKSTQITKTLFDGTYPFTGNEGESYWSDPIPTDEALVDGNTYTVTFDGTAYSCVREVYYGTPYLGSEEINEQGVAGDYPFYIEIYNGAFYVGTTEIGASHSVKLEGPASSIEPGTAMIFNGTEWIPQSGYGYTLSESQTISWNGDTTGKDSVTIDNRVCYKISDTVFTIDEITGAVVSAGGSTCVVTDDLFNQIGNRSISGQIATNTETAYIFSCGDTVIDYGSQSITLPSTGTYVSVAGGVSEISPFEITTQKKTKTIDKDLISGGNVFTVNPYTMLAEVIEAYQKYGKVYLQDGQIYPGVPVYVNYVIERFNFYQVDYNLTKDSNPEIRMQLVYTNNGEGFNTVFDDGFYSIAVSYSAGGTQG